MAQQAWGRLPRWVRRLGRHALRINSAVTRRVRRQRRPPCVIGIPMMNLHEATARVIADLDFADFDELIIFDHASDDSTSIAWLRQIARRPKVTVDLRGIIPEESLYRAWNDTIRVALARFRAREVDVVLLNNDVRIPRGFVRFLTRAMWSGDPKVMIAYPDATAQRKNGLPDRTELTPTKGLHADGGMTDGHFALKAEAFRGDLPFIDERLKFYSGDRDLVHDVETRGYYAARVNGLPCEHKLGMTRRHRRDLVQQQNRDIALWWGEHRDGLK